MAEERAGAAIGTRVRAAREDVGLTQHELAASVGLDRSAIAKIETGSRKVTALELSSIADRLNVRLEWLVRDAPDAVLSRRNMREPGAVSPAIDRITERFAREVEFVMEHDDALASLSVVDPLPWPSNRSAIETTASNVREQLGLELDEPLLEISRCFAAAGLLTFSVDLGKDAADGSSMLLATGGVAVVNGHLHVGRRRLTLAHEFGHYLFADEFSVDWQVADSTRSDNRESRIDHFARALLLPGEAVKSEWARHQATGRTLREAAVLVASQYRVDMSTLARRLFELRVISNDEAQQVRDVRTTRSDIVDFDLLIRDELAAPELPRPYVEAVLRLYRRETISPARAIDLLFDTWEEADLPALPMLPEEAIWSFVS